MIRKISFPPLDLKTDKKKKKFDNEILGIRRQIIRNIKLCKFLGRIKKEFRQEMYLKKRRKVVRFYLKNSSDKSKIYSNTNKNLCIRKLQRYRKIKIEKENKNNSSVRCLCQNSSKNASTSEFFGTGNC